MASYEATGANLMLNYFHYLLADVYRISGRTAEGLQVINKAIEFTDKCRYPLDRGRTVWSQG